MKGNILVLVALFALVRASGPWTEGLKVRFGIGLFPGRNFFIDLPQTVTAAKNARWVESPRPAGQPLPSLTLYNPSTDDVVIGTLYDSQGDVAGLQIALPQDVFEDSSLDWGTRGFVNWTAPANSAGARRSYWVTAQYFVSEATLALSPKERAARRRGRILQEDYMYVTGFHGQLLPISTTAAGITQSNFTIQSCVPFMGRHWFYNMSSTTPCNSETMLPWFTLEDASADQLLATGLVTFGRLPASALVRDYFERFSTFLGILTVPNGPACLYQLSDDYGLLTMHLYYVDSPLLINCIGL